MNKDDQYSEAETVRRREATLKRMLSTPPKQHADMKIGKAKPTKECPASKGRVHKGRKKI